jgi:hypothetical protein
MLSISGKTPVQDEMTRAVPTCKDEPPVRTDEKESDESIHD